MNTSFAIEQNISIIAGSYRCDLHNDFDFFALEYLPMEKRLFLDWRICPLSSPPKESPSRLRLMFESMERLSVQARGKNADYADDKCVNSISFSAPGLEKDFDAISDVYRSDEEHLSISFMSGFGIKIWAARGLHEVTLRG